MKKIMKPKHQTACFSKLVGVCLMFVFCCIAQKGQAQDRPAQVSLSTEIGKGMTRDTYLAPLLYRGSLLGVRFDRQRTMRGGVWQNFQIIDAEFFSGDAEHGKNSTMWSGRFSYRYAMHCPILTKTWLSDKGVSILIGPFAGLEAGFDYNLKIAGSNNPVNARCAMNLGASVAGVYNYTLFGRPCSVDFLAQIPMVGSALMPEYGQSYYEAFLLDDGKHTMNFTSLHNQQDLDVRLSTNIPLAVIPWFKKIKTVVKIGGYYHIETMDINNIVTRYSSVGLTIGWTWRYLPL